MAVVTTRNPIYVSGDVISGSTKITDKFVYVQKVLWTGVTTAGHKATCTTIDGSALFDLIADAPGVSGEMMYSLDFYIEPHPCNGIYVTDLDSGDLYFYLVYR